jgi:HSP20 family protein
MARDLVHIMRSFFLPAAEAFREACWRPSTDIYRTPEGWLIKLDLAGVRPDDVGLSVSGRRLRVKGIRRDINVDDVSRCYRLEIAYSHFERDIEMPIELDPARMATEYRDGMLLVRVKTGPR